MMHEITDVLQQLDVSFWSAGLAGVVCAGSCVAAFRALVGKEDQLTKRLHEDRSALLPDRQHFWAYRVTEVSD